MSNSRFCHHTLFNNILVEEATVQSLLKARSRPLNKKPQVRSAYLLLQLMDGGPGDNASENRCDGHVIAQVNAE